MAIKLPERNYLTFPELMKRWECEEDDLRRLIISGALKPSYVVNDGADLVTLVPPGEGPDICWDWEPKQVENDVDYDQEEDREACKYKRVYTGGFYFLLLPEQTGPLDCSFVYFSKDRKYVPGSDTPCLMFGPGRKDRYPLKLSDVMKDGAVFLEEIEEYEVKNTKDEVPEKQERPPGRRERENLLKLVIGMAIAGYRHDPGAPRNTTPKEIADDLAKLGLRLGDDTIRKYLKEAADTVLPAKPRQS